MKRSTRRLSASIAGVVALVALVGISGTVQASAAVQPAPATTYHTSHLCIDDPNNPGDRYCIQYVGQGQDVEVPPLSSSTTTWTYPAASGNVGEIYTGADTCLQLNAAGGDTIRAAACVNDNAELWINVPFEGRTHFVSYYYYAMNHSAVNCLSGGGYPVIVDLIACGDEWYNAWGTS